MKYLLQHNIITKSSRIGLVCNQTAWHLSSKKYSIQRLIEKGLHTKAFDLRTDWLYHCLKNKSETNWQLAIAIVRDNNYAFKEASPFLVYKPSLQQLKIK